jgi:hypothetical protein
MLMGDFCPAAASLREGDMTVVVAYTSFKLNTQKRISRLAITWKFNVG